MILLNFTLLLLIFTELFSACKFGESYYNVNWFEKYDNYPISEFYWYERFNQETSKIQMSLNAGVPESIHERECLSAERVDASATIYHYVDLHEKKHFCVKSIFDGLKKSVLVEKMQVAEADNNNCKELIETCFSRGKCEMYWKISLENSTDEIIFAPVVSPIQGEYQLNLVTDFHECIGVKNSLFVANRSRISINACSGVASSNRYKNKLLLASTVECISAIKMNDSREANLKTELAQYYLLLHLDGALFCARYTLSDDGTIQLAINIDETHSSGAWCGARSDNWRQETITLKLTPSVTGGETVPTQLDINRVTDQTASVEPATGNDLVEFPIIFGPSTVNYRGNDMTESESDNIVKDGVFISVEADNNDSDFESASATKFYANRGESTKAHLSIRPLSSKLDTYLNNSPKSSTIQEISTATPSTKSEEGTSTIHSDDPATTLENPAIAKAYQFPSLFCNQCSRINGDSLNNSVKIFSVFLVLLFVVILLAILIIVFKGRKSSSIVSSRTIFEMFGQNNLSNNEDNKSIEAGYQFNQDDLMLVESTIPRKQ